MARGRVGSLVRGKRILRRAPRRRASSTAPKPPRAPRRGASSTVPKSVLPETRYRGVSPAGRQTGLGIHELKPKGATQAEKAVARVLARRTGRTPIKRMAR